MLYAGSTANQVDNFSCTNFCLLAQTTCSCTRTGTILLFEVRNNSISVGQRTLRSDDLNMPKKLFELNTFNTLLTDSSNGTLTATLEFTAIPEYQGYAIICEPGGGSPLTVFINIQGMNYNYHT